MVTLKSFRKTLTNNYAKNPMKKVMLRKNFCRENDFDFQPKIRSGKTETCMYGGELISREPIICLCVCALRVFSFHCLLGGSNGAI